jgi:hypothetical protein
MRVTNGLAMARGGADVQPAVVLLTPIRSARASDTYAMKCVQALVELIAEATADQSAELLDAVVVDAVDRSVSIRCAGHQSVTPQQAEVPRNIRLAESGLGDEVVDGSLALYQQVEQTEPRWIAEDPKPGRNQAQDGRIE